MTLAAMSTAAPLATLTTSAPVRTMSPVGPGRTSPSSPVVSAARAAMA